MVITLLHEVINMVTEDPKNAVSQCLSYVSTPSSSPQTIRKSRPTLDSETAKVHLSLKSHTLQYITKKICTFPSCAKSTKI
jgi:hypothetical protein